MQHNIHFPVISSLTHRVPLSNVARGRGIAKRHKFEVNFSYNVIRTWDHDNIINSPRIGETVYDIQDLDHIITLINNYKYNKNLLDGIPVNSNLKQTIDDITLYYNKLLDYDCILLSVFRPFLFINMYIGFLIKRKNPNIDVMIGGPQINLSPGTVKILRYIKVFDYVIEGDIESALYEYLLGRLDKYHDYKLIFDLNEYITPIYSSLELKLFRDILIDTSRGCTNICSFCPSSGEGFREVKTNDIIDAFKYYNDIGKNIDCDITIADCVLNYRKRNIKELLEGLISIRNSLPVSANMIFRNLDSEIIDSLKRSNFASLFLGVDSSHDIKARDIMFTANKKRDNYIDIISELYNKDFALVISLIYNCPGESEEMFESDFEFIKTLRKNFPDKTKLIIDFLSYQHLAGSTMFTNPSRFGIEIQNWDSMACYDDGLNDVVINVPKYFYSNISSQEYVRRYELGSRWEGNISNKYMSFERCIDVGKCV